MKEIWVFMAFVAGTLLPIQAALNTRMGKAIESPAYATLISFVAGTIVVALYIIFTRQHVAWQGIKTVPRYAWLAGGLGAFYVMVSILAFPRIGPALTFALVIGGQMIIAVLLEHFNILVAQQQSINIWRILGVALIIGGVIIIRKF